MIVGNGHGDQGSNPEQGISHSANTLGKAMHPTILRPAMGKCYIICGFPQICDTV